MKRLNKKGFTLIELLAIIVILAIIMVITIPTVLSSMEKARKNSYETALQTIADYMNKTVQACSLGDEDLSDCNTDIFGDSFEIAADPISQGQCVSGNSCNSEAQEKVIIAAGYKQSDIGDIYYNFDGTKVTLEGGKAGADGKFKGVEASY